MRVHHAFANAFGETVEKFHDAFPHIAIHELVSALLRLSDLTSRLNYYNLKACNKELTPFDEKCISDMEMVAEDIARLYKWQIELTRDPMAHAIRIYLPSGRNNSWSGAWGIPSDKDE